MPGGADPLYVLARAALLDALEAFGLQRDAIILVGAQAVYLHTGNAELAVPEYTTDADLVIDPGLLRDLPEIQATLTAAGFVRGQRVGAWATTKELAGRLVAVELDVMVPEAVGGPGRRAARLPAHAADVARKARGLEAALTDKSPMTITALDPADERSWTIAVAGPAALLVSKLHKIQERLAEGRPRRLDDKDALDALRLLQAVPTASLSRVFARLAADRVAGTVSQEALTSLRILFGDARSVGSQMAVRAAGPLADPGVIAASCAALAKDLLDALSLDRPPR